MRRGLRPHPVSLWSSAPTGDRVGAVPKPPACGGPKGRRPGIKVRSAPRKRRQKARRPQFSGLAPQSRATYRPERQGPRVQEGSNAGSWAERSPVSVHTSHCCAQTGRGGPGQHRPARGHPGAPHRRQAPSFGNPRPPKKNPWKLQENQVNIRNWRKQKTAACPKLLRPPRQPHKVALPPALALRVMARAQEAAGGRRGTSVFTGRRRGMSSLWHPGAVCSLAGRGRGADSGFRENTLQGQAHQNLSVTPRASVLRSPHGPVPLAGARSSCSRASWVQGSEQQPRPHWPALPAHLPSRGAWRPPQPCGRRHRPEPVNSLEEGA